MAVPKRKSSKARRDKRRASTTKIDAPNLIDCPNCQAKTVAHRVCPACGFYKGKEVIAVD